MKQTRHLKEETFSKGIVTVLLEERILVSGFIKFRWNRKLWDRIVLIHIIKLNPRKWNLRVVSFRSRRNRMNLEVLWTGDSLRINPARLTPARLTEFKPVLLCLKIDLVSHPACGLGKYIQIKKTCLCGHKSKCHH